jgi:ubiquinone/menaquinone biosynthesis C-methylase UbiE
VWADFWSGEHSIYVNERHARVHYERIARDLTRLLASRPQSSGLARVLDWGCGDALGAPEIVGTCSELLLYDAVDAVQQRLRRRFAGMSRIRVLDNSEWRTFPSASVDVIVLNSVAQYVGRGELERILDEFRRVVRPDGEVIVADIIRPDTGMVADIASLLGSGLGNGFFFAACLGLVRTFFSEYRKIRARAGFSTYREREFLELLEARGFAAERLPRNVGFNQQRMTFRARPK